MNLELSALDTLDHLALHVADIEASVRWYQTSFQCEVVSQSVTTAVLQFRNVRLMLSLPSQQPPHVAFQKTNAHEFGAMRKNSDGTQSSYVADPTGNIVELVAPHDRSKA